MRKTLAATLLARPAFAVFNVARTVVAVGAATAAFAAVAVIATSLSARVDAQQANRPSLITAEQLAGGTANPAQ